MEFVYVVPREKLFRDCYPQGLVSFGAELERASFEDAVHTHGFFVEREYAERTPTLKQVIPYAITVCDGEVLLLRRLAQSGEARLHDKLSIGVGGHINPEDLGDTPAGSPNRSKGRNPIAAGTRREITEELDVVGDSSLRAVGIINDDSNSVGAVHVGLVQVLTVEGSVDIREKDVLEGRLVPPAELERLLGDGANFETWSSMLVPQLGDLLPHPLPALS